MKAILAFFFFLLMNTVGLAHEPNEAFFTYFQKENSVEVRAELPWSMRNALLEFNPSLEKANHKNDFESTFKEYIKTNLILKDKDGLLLSFQGFEELENIGHSHQNDYLVLFQGQDLAEVENTFMFNLYENQVNYNTLNNSDKIRTVKTQKGLSHFYVNQKSSNNYWYLLLLILPLIYVFRRARSDN